MIRYGLPNRLKDAELSTVSSLVESSKFQQTFFFPLFCVIVWEGDTERASFFLLDCDTEKGAGLLDEKRCGHPAGGAGTAHAMRVASLTYSMLTWNAFASATCTPRKGCAPLSSPPAPALRLRGEKLAVEHLYLWPAAKYVLYSVFHWPVNAWCENCRGV